MTTPLLQHAGESCCLIRHITTCLNGFHSMTSLSNEKTGLIIYRLYTGELRCREFNYSQWGRLRSCVEAFNNNIPESILDINDRELMLGICPEYGDSVLLIKKIFYKNPVASTLTVWNATLRSWFYRQLNTDQLSLGDNDV